MADVYRNELKAAQGFGAAVRRFINLVTFREQRVVARAVNNACGNCVNAAPCCAALRDGDLNSDVPGFCRNSDLFVRLQHEIEAERSAGTVTR